MPERPPDRDDAGDSAGPAAPLRPRVPRTLPAAAPTSPSEASPRTGPAPRTPPAGSTRETRETPAAPSRPERPRREPPDDRLPPSSPPRPPEPADEPANARLAGVLALIDRRFLVLGIAVVALAAGLRLVELALNPFHHDEGINGWFVTQLVRSGTWTYDPANYHGPTLFYFALASEVLLGLTTEAMRLVPALFGIGTVALLLALRPFVGSVAALVAALLLAISPGSVYVSRYFIHEHLLVFLTLAIVVSLLWYLRDGRERFLYLAAAAAALHFATKETGIVSLVVLGIALAVGRWYVRVRLAGDGAAAPARVRSKRQRDPALADWRQVWRQRFPVERLATAGAVFLAVYVPLFSSFFSNPQGVLDSLATFAVWTQTGGETQVQPIYRYLEWMLAADLPILALGLIGGLLVAYRGRDLTPTVIGLWALGITLAYSLVTYKTPWIALNMLVPLAILGGLAVAEVVQRVRSTTVQAVAAAGLVAALGLGAYQTVDFNFRHYDDETYPYSFVHTTRSALDLVAETTRIAALAPDDRNGIVFVSPDYWPLPWYFRDNPKAGFFGQIVPTEEAVIVANVNQEPELDPAVIGGYRRTSEFQLRPGVNLVIYVRSDIAAR